MRERKKSEGGAFIKAPPPGSYRVNVREMNKLKLLKFYYRLSYDLLPPYCNKYIEIIEQKPARDLRFQYIHAPLVKRVYYAECSPLFQLIKLINSLRNDPNDTI